MGEVDRLMLLCPPQHGKSTVASKRLPAYMLGRNPHLDIISGSATGTLAEEFGGAVRDCVNSQEFGQLFPVNLAEDSQAKGRWQTTEGGGYYAVGIGGALFGRGAGLGIVDDPFATWADAQSEGARNNVWGWYRGTFYNRIRPGGAIVIIQHRMHEQDLVGRLLEEQKNGGDKWEVVNLPAHIDNPPWPERYDSAALLRIKANTDLRQWSSLYMQDPTPDDGTFFQKGWFRRYRKGDEPKNLNHYMTSDHAPGGGEENDFSGARVWGVDKEGDLYLLDGFRAQETMDKTVDKALALAKRYKPFAWFPEADNNWKTVHPFVIRRMRELSIYVRIEPLSPHGSDKPTKAGPFQAMAASGRVWIPQTPEGDEIIGQYLKFPAGSHDDEVDLAALMGKALDDAHPAIVPAKEAGKKRNDYDSDDNEEDSWKTK